MAKTTISVYQLFEMFPDQETARVYLERRLWPNGVRCPFCEQSERITKRKDGFYRCNPCKKDFTVRTGTIFERSHVPLHKWIYAMYLLVTARKGISSLQLSKEIGVTQKTAWFMLGRLREACGDKLDKLRGIVEIDETYVGGKESNKHADKKLRAGRGAVGKTAVLGMRERDGRTRAMPIEATDSDVIHDEIRENIEIHDEIRENIEPGSTIHTDEFAAYRGLVGFTHESINHGASEFVRDDVTTNSIESFFAVFKRGVYGTFHHVSPKHMHRYVDEFAFRLNEGNVKRHTTHRIDSFVDGTAGRRLTYKDLIG